MEPQTTTLSAPTRYSTVSNSGRQPSAQLSAGGASPASPQQTERSHYSAEETERCPDCHCDTIVTSEGEEYCEECWLVLSDGTLEYSEPEWRDESERRLGPQQTVQWLNTGSEIGTTSDPAFKRIAAFNKRVTDSERSLVEGLRELRTLASSLDLPECCRNRGAYLYRECLENDLLKGRSIDGITAACLYIAAREQQRPVTLSDIAGASPIEESEIRHYLGVLQVKLPIEFEPAVPQDFLQRVVSALPVSMEVERKASSILDSIVDEEAHIGKKPVAIAATAVYAAANQLGEELSQAAVAEAVDASAVTISRRYQDVKSILGE